MKVPKMFGRKMKMVKKYEHFILFVDEETGIRESFQYWELYLEDRTRNDIQKKQRTDVKNDSRLLDLIGDIEKYME